MAESPPPSPDWAHLPIVAVQIVSEKIKSISDYVRFRTVCSPWRSASLPKPHHLPPQLPWLMIPYYPNPEEDDLGCKKDDGIRFFYDLSQSKMHQLYLPETSGKMCCATYRGWLVLVENEGKEVLLLNPLTRAQVQLPSFTTPAKIFGVDQEECRYEAHYWFVPCIGNFVISKLFFSTDLTDPNCLIMVFLQRTCRIFFCRVGDPCWTMVNMQPEEIRTEKFSDAVYYDGRCYLLSHDGVMRIYNLADPQKKIAFAFQPELQDVSKFLLERKSGVYMVMVHQIEEEEGEADKEEEQEEEEEEKEEEEEHDPVRGTEKGDKHKIELYQLLDKPLGLLPITDTSNTTLFYGDNHHYLALCSDDWDSLNGNHIYMEYVCEPSAGKDKGSRCYGIFSANLDDGKSEAVVHDIGERPQLWPAAPAMWFQPSFV